MFILLDIEDLSADLQNLPPDCTHTLTFKAIFTIKDVPDTFTGTVYQDASGELKLAHFNNPKGNKRKVITLKNKLPQGSTQKIEQWMFDKSQGESLDFPLQIKTLFKKRRVASFGG